MNRHRSGAAVALIAVALVASGASSATAHEVEKHAAGRSQDAARPLDPHLVHLPRASDLPPGAVRISPHVPGMGEHWANPRDLPLGPVYCVMEGRVTCMEFMISQQDLRDGKSFERLRPWFAGGAPQPSVDHVEFNFMPQGHLGFEVPHYDVHMYFVPPELREQDRQARQAAR